MSKPYDIFLQFAEGSDPIGLAGDTPVRSLDGSTLITLEDALLKPEFADGFQVHHASGWLNARYVHHKLVNASITIKTSAMPSEKATPELVTQLTRVLNDPGVITLLEAAGLSDVEVSVDLL